MIRLIKYIFVVAVMLTASVFAGEPATWNVSVLDSDILEIKDSQGKTVALQILSAVQQDKTWNVSSLNSKIAEVKDAAGTVVGMVVLSQDAEYYRLIDFKGKTYLLPQYIPMINFANAAQPNQIDEQPEKKSRTATVHSESSDDDRVFLPNEKEKKLIKYDDVALDKAVCWQIDPDHLGMFQLLDKDGKVLCSKPVMTQSERRGLIDKKLKICCKRVKYSKF